MAEKDPSGWYGNHMPRNPEIIVPAGKSTPGKSRHDISIFELILLVFVLLAAILFFSFLVLLNFLF